MGTLLNRRRYMGGGSALPYDAEVEYIQSNGTQILDTGIQGGSDVGYKIDFQIIDSNVNYAHVWGSTKIPYAPKLYRSGNTSNWLIEYGNGTTKTAFYILKGSTSYERHIIEYTNGVVYLDNVSKLNIGTKGFGNLNFCLFGYFGENNLNVKAMVYSCKIWVDGTLVRDFIPVRCNAIGYLYDKVSKQLFGDANGGSFTAGPDKT